MTRIFITLLLNTFVLFVHGQQHNHGGMVPKTDTPHRKEPPHGGEITNVGRYCFEILLNPFYKEGKVNVYILHKNFKPVKTKTISGKALVKYEDGKEETIDLLYDLDKLSCNPSDMTKPFSLLLTIFIKEKEFNLVYGHEGI